MTAEPVNDIDLAQRLADAAGSAVLPYFRSPGLDVRNKAGDTSFDPVTQADRAAERAMRALLAEHRPQDGILGEEEDDVAGTSGRVWVLDPIDGTRGFLSGTPTWGVLVALNEGGHPTLGIIDQPYIGERFVGAAGVARLCGPRGERALATRATDRLADAIVFTTFPEIGTPADRDAFQRVAGQARLVRYGMDCYAYALLAAGQIDLVIEAGLQPYDIQAPIAVIEAAGGLVTSWEGGPATLGGRVIAAANPAIHRAALARLSAG